MDRKFYDNEREIDLAEQKTLHKRGKQIVSGRTIIFILMVSCFANNVYARDYEGDDFTFDVTYPEVVSINFTLSFTSSVLQFKNVP